MLLLKIEFYVKYLMNKAIRRPIIGYIHVKVQVDWPFSLRICIYLYIAIAYIYASSPSSLDSYCILLQSPQPFFSSGFSKYFLKNWDSLQARLNSH